MSDKLRALLDHVIFQFEEGKKKHMGVNQFEQTTESGIVYTRTDDSTSSPRWGIVVTVGPDVPEEIKPGMRVLIDPLAWTPEIEVDDQDYSRTDYDKLIGYDPS